MCFISTEKKMKAYFECFCYSTVNTQTWEWHWSSLGRDNRTGIFPEEIINITSLCALQGWMTVFGATRISKPTLNITLSFSACHFWTNCPVGVCPQLAEIWESGAGNQGSCQSRVTVKTLSAVVARREESQAHGLWELRPLSCHWAQRYAPSNVIHAPATLSHGYSPSNYHPIIYQGNYGYTEGSR